MNRFMVQKKEVTDEVVTRRWVLSNFLARLSSQRNYPNVGGQLGSNNTPKAVIRQKDLYLVRIAYFLFMR